MAAAAYFTRAGRLGPAETAARLHGAADAEITAGQELGTIGWSDMEQQLKHREQGLLRGILGDAAYEVAARAGTALSRREVLELALAATLVQPEPVG